MSKTSGQAELRQRGKILRLPCKGTVEHRPLRRNRQHPYTILGHGKTTKGSLKGAERKRHRKLNYQTQKTIKSKVITCSPWVVSENSEDMEQRGIGKTGTGPFAQSLKGNIIGVKTTRPGGRASGVEHVRAAFLFGKRRKLKLVGDDGESGKSMNEGRYYL